MNKDMPAAIDRDGGPVADAGEVRLALTWRCNFRCSFCHREGQGQSRPGDPSVREVLDLLEREIRAGGRDVTLTGGEPLLKRRLLAGVIRGLARFPSAWRPALTIVSNGACWDDEIIRLIAAYPGRCKVNISLHAADADTYDAVTGTHRQHVRALATINSLVAAGVTVKLNVVVLRGVNDRRENLEQMVVLARQLGVQAVKFLELLLPCGTEMDARHVGCDEIEGQLGQLGFREESVSARGVAMKHVQFQGFLAEVKRCSCALGCGRCREAMARNFGPDLQLQPCFMSSAAEAR